MVKKKNGRKFNLSGKPKLSMDVNRSDGKSVTRSTATAPRLGMLNARKIPKHGSQDTHPQVKRDEETLRRELEESIIRSPWGNPKIALRLKKMSLSYLIDLKMELNRIDSKEFLFKDSFGSKEKKKSLLMKASKYQDGYAFNDAFDSKGRTKHPKLLADDYESLLKKANKSQDAYEEIAPTSSFPKGCKRFRNNS
ncbi:hypothetical protein C5167_026245 [Papaver somniferum]|uniref:nuclear/nucleolar GTPase 2-like n=1 Tax=Papaver somniferum TaxID=3469 RepID=UPI000E6FE273|nr:nuclear/nucleolar GTPase 2-like [Papaver somniferum]RZC94514.1 hypothetical protein C5167_026245 [Papaver somniferum]